jgi:hypothetical protein
MMSRSTVLKIRLSMSMIIAITAIVIKNKKIERIELKYANIYTANRLIATVNMKIFLIVDSM